MRKIFTLWSIFFCMLSFPILFSSCGNEMNLQQEIEPSASFAPYISGYSGGLQSVVEPIIVELANPYPEAKPGESVNKALFSIKPTIEGTTVWKDDKTIQFIPKNPLESNTNYIVDFALSQLYDVAYDLNVFKFSFRTIKSGAELSFKDYIQEEGNRTYASLIFNLNLSDKIDMSNLDKYLLVKDGKGVKLSYKVHAVNAKKYEIQVDSITRETAPREVVLELDGSSMGFTEIVKTNFTVPASDDFSVIMARRMTELSEEDADGYEIIFSDAINPNQHYNSYVVLGEFKNFSRRVEDNRLYLYTSEAKTDSIQLQVYPQFESAYGQKLDKVYQQFIQTKSLKPNVSIVSTGTILPDSKEQVITFTAQALEFVELRVVKVYANNILQMYQSYSMTSNDMLQRVGRLILEKRINLKELATKPLDTTQAFHLDLAPLFEQEPGAMYHIQLFFKPEYTTLPEFTSRRANLDLVEVSEDIEFKESQWDSPEDSYSLMRAAIPYDWNVYDWKRQADPSHMTFYMADGNVSTSTTVYTSKIGLTVKKNDLGKLWFAVNDILTTKPMQGVAVKLYSYQLQELGIVHTDKEGFAQLECKGVPYIAVASYDKDKTYLKIPNGNQLEVSRFDVGGVVPSNGLKGYIYGERGVWRPGDDIHLTFVLMDQDSRIPNNHPVSLELFNPKGQFYTKMMATSHTDGVYYFNLKTDANDPTGTWNAYVKLGGSTFHKALMVETIKPNRLKINLDFTEDVLVSGNPAYAKLSSHWLMGALASNLPAKIELKVSPIRSAFPKYDSYLFTDLNRKFTNGGSQTLFDGHLNNDGIANLVLNIPQYSNAPSMLKAQITTRVYEPSGDFSIHSQAMTLSPYSSYVGIKLNKQGDDYYETDTPIKVDAIRLNPQGKPMGGGNITYQIYKLDWSWWYDQENLLTKYVNNSSVKPVHTGNLTFGSDGKTQFSFEELYPSYGRYLIYVKDKDSGHAVSQVVYIDWPSWRGRASRGNPDGETFLSFSMDKKKYQVGETVEVTLPSSSDGRALVSIENGSQVLSYEWVDVRKDQDVKYKFKATKEMTPNAYVFVSLLQPHAQTVNNLPIRMYGIEPLIVEDEATHLKPVIDMPKVVEPEKKFTVKIKEANKKQMTYTLALVDDGLLDLTAFKTPNPWDYFYSKEALGIHTWDMYDDVIGALGAVYTQKYRVGGDEMLNPADTKANRFNPVVKFLGPFTLKAGGTAQHDITLPMYVGSIRTMVVASDGYAFGNAEQNTIVRSPLMLIPSLPRVLSITDEVWIPVNIFVMEDGVKSVKVKVSTSDNLKVEGGNTQTIQFKQTGDQIVYFKMKVGNKVGIEKINFEAQGNSFVAKQEIEIDVRNPNPLYTHIEKKLIDKKSSYTFNKIKPTDAEILQNTIEFSHLPSVNLTSRMEYLSHYIHNCTEQIVSKALPFFYIKEFQNQDKAMEEKQKESIQGTIKELYSRQLSDGSFTYWPNQSYSNPWSTAYATFFLVKAKELGYNVNASTINRAVSYLSRVARVWSASNRGWTYSSYVQAYNLYVLAVAGQPDLAAMNRLKDYSDLSEQGRWLLASAYAIMGKKDIGNSLVFNLSPRLTSYFYDYYGSAIRDDAFVLQALVLLGQESKAFETARNLAEKLNEETYYQTQSTAMGILALGEYLRGMKGQEIDLTIQVGNAKSEKLKTPHQLIVFSDLDKTKSEQVKVTNNTESVVHGQLVEVLRLFKDTLPAVNDRYLTIGVVYTDLNGKSISLEDLKVGEDVVATIAVSNPSLDGYENIALTHIIPASWEVYQVVGNDEGVDSSRNDGGLTYQDIKDDRVLSYFNLNGRGRKLIQVRFHVTYAGTYVLPAIQADVMYQPDVFARTKAGQIAVSRK